MATPTRPTSNGDGRYGGGVAGPESRYCRQAVDVTRFEDATEGKSPTSPLHKGAPNREAAAVVNTMDGPARGSCMGASYPKDKWTKGF